MPERRIPPKVVLGSIALGIALVAVAAFLLSDSTVLRATAIIVLLAYLVFVAASDWVEAWLNERHVEAHPHLLKNDAVGEVVTVIGDFAAQAGSATGKVMLNGENWKAYCSGNHLPKDGETMIVRAREGLTLVVQPHGGTDSACQALSKMGLQSLATIGARTSRRAYQELLTKEIS